MNQIFTPGQTVYVLFWRNPEERELCRVAFYTTERGRDNLNIELLSYGMITKPDTWKIPRPARGRKGLKGEKSKLARRF